MENEKLYKKVKRGQGGIEVKGEVGLVVGTGYKENDKLIIGAFGGGKINITGGRRIQYPYKGDENKMAVDAYVNPLMYNFTFETKLGPLNKEFSYSGILIDIKIESEPIIINLQK